MFNRREVIKAGLGIVAAAATMGHSASADGKPPRYAGSELQENPRLRLNFNHDYKFLLGDSSGAENAGFDDGGWEYVCLPHCFSTPYWGAPQFYVGYGWYRKTFDVPAAWLDKTVFIEFEGAFQEAEVFINGASVGSHKGGYTGFVIGISSRLRKGENLLAVRLNNLWDAQTAPRAGEHQFAGGLYRNVWLHVTDPVHIPYCGISLSTPKVSQDEAIVTAETQILNGSSESKLVTLTTRIGEDESTATTSARIEPGQLYSFHQNMAISGKPKLWHPDTPFLYSVTSIVSCDGKVVDRRETPLGIRWLEFTAEGGFFLNGTHYLIHGVNVHQDHAGWCNAVTNAGFERDIQMVKEAGFNFIRGSHYPHSTAFYEACDRLGVLVWSELCFWGIGGFGSDGDWSSSAYPVDPIDREGFEQSCKDTLTEMILRFRNNPSIVVWSMCNEVFFSDGSVMPQVRDLLTQLVALSHSLDSSRPAGIGGCQRGELDHLGDIAGYNGDGARLFIDPGIPSLVSEYGSCGDIRPGGFDGCFGDTAMQPDFLWRAGKALWCMFDHGSIASIGRLGCVDYFRLPKRRWYWYRQANCGVPPPVWPQSGVPAALQLTASSSTIRNDGTDDCRIVVTVVDSGGIPISNCPPVTLAVEDGPGQFPTGRQIPFTPHGDISIYDGVASIEFRSQYPGQTVIRATSPGLTDGVLTITVVGTVSSRNAIQQPLPIVLEGPVTGSVFAASSASVDLAANRPTLASSEAAGHAANLANDGDPKTWWQAAGSGAGEWWQVDLENLYEVTETTTLFSMPEIVQYTIALSADQQNWTVAVDQRASTVSSAKRTDRFPASSVGRFLRIVFTGTEGVVANIAELEVIGVRSGRT